MVKHTLPPSFVQHHPVDGNTANLMLLSYLVDENLKVANRGKKKTNFIQAELYDSSKDNQLLPSLGLGVALCGRSFDRKHFVLAQDSYSFKKFASELKKNFEAVYEHLLNLLPEVKDGNTEAFRDTVRELAFQDPYRYFEKVENLTSFLLYQCIGSNDEQTIVTGAKKLLDMSKQTSLGDAEHSILYMSLKAYVDGMANVELKPALLKPNKKDQTDASKASESAIKIFDTHPLLYTTLPDRLEEEDLELFLSLLTADDKMAHDTGTDISTRLFWIVGIDDCAPAKKGLKPYDDTANIYNGYDSFINQFKVLNIFSFPFFVELHRKLAGATRDYYLVKYREKNSPFESNVCFLTNYDISAVNLDTLCNEYFHDARKGKLYIYKLHFEKDPNKCTLSCPNITSVAP